MRVLLYFSNIGIVDLGSLKFNIKWEKILKQGISNGRSVPQVVGLISEVILYQKSIFIYVDFNIALCNW